MKKPLIIANWKLSLDYDAAIHLATQLTADAQDFSEYADVIICPPALALPGVKQVVGDESKIQLGIQNIFYEIEGAYTGENSARAAHQVGARYAIIGHSERRKYFHETNEDVWRKVQVAIDTGLTPILCIGETYEDRQAGQAELVVARELQSALRDIPAARLEKLIIAYEPVWAIGTGQAIQPEQARMMGLVIRQQLIDMFGSVDSMQVIYGGSVDASNVKDFVDMKVLTGVLVGGASQQFASFRALVLKFGKK